MLDSKVIRLIQALLSKELSTVERYLCAPYVSSNDECARLFVQICKFLPDMDSPKLTKERLFSKIFGKRPYNDGKMRKLMTQLTQLIEQYLMERELKNSEELRSKLLAKALSERNNYKLFLDVVESRLKVLDNGMDRGRDYFRESHALSEMLYYHPGSVRLVKKEEYRQRAGDDLERYFTVVMLQNEANNIVVNRVVNTAEQRSGYLNKVLEMAGMQPLANYNAIQLFHHLIMLLQSKSVEDLDKLRKTAFEAFPHLSQFEQDFATNLLRSYAVPFINSGSKEHARFVLDLYKLELERGFFANTISAGSFLNIVTVGLLVDEFDWVQYFLDNFDTCIPEGEREYTLNYCRGIWNYHKGLRNNNIDLFYDAIQYLNLIPTRAGANYELRVRPALLRIHFEIFIRGKEMLDDILTQLRNFERHLKGSDEYANLTRDAYLRFIRYFKTLARMADSIDTKKSNKVKFLEKLNRDDSGVAFKPWLIEKVKELASTG